MAPSLREPSRGADDGIRTRDPHLGKVMLYQLSHVRVFRHDTNCVHNAHAWVSVARQVDTQCQHTIGDVP